MHNLLFVVGDNVETQLEAFDEALEVEPRVLPIGDKQWADIRKHYAAFASWEKPGSRALIPEDAHEGAYEAILEDWDGRSGVMVGDRLHQVLTRNPRGKWDWYEIGGRWDSYLVSKCGCPAGNVTRVGNVDWDLARESSLMPFAILADGAFQEREEWCWDYVENEGERVTHFSREDWTEHCYEFFTRLAPETRITVVDYHH